MLTRRERSYSPLRRQHAPLAPQGAQPRPPSLAETRNPAQTARHCRRVSADLEVRDAERRTASVAISSALSDCRSAASASDWALHIDTRQATSLGRRSAASCMLWATNEWKAHSRRRSNTRLPLKLGVKAAVLTQGGRDLQQQKRNRLETTGRYTVRGGGCGALWTRSRLRMNVEAPASPRAGVSSCAVKSASVSRIGRTTHSAARVSSALLVPAGWLVRSAA